MPVTRVRSARRSSNVATPEQPVATLVGADGRRVTLPYAPRGGDLAGVVPLFEESERVGREPVLEDAGPDLQRRNYTLTIGHHDHQRSIASKLAQLQRLARSGQRVRWQGLSAQEGALWWRVTGYSEAILLRQAGTNEPTRAEVSIDLAQHVEAQVRITPMPRPPAPKPPAAEQDRSRTYTVVKGDTLWGTSERYYGTGTLWRTIADANGVRDPRKLQIGHVLTIPPRP